MLNTISYIFILFVINIICIIILKYYLLNYTMMKTYNNNQIDNCNFNMILLNLYQIIISLFYFLSFIDKHHIMLDIIIVSQIISCLLYIYIKHNLYVVPIKFFSNIFEYAYNINIIIMTSLVHKIVTIILIVPFYITNDYFHCLKHFTNLILWGSISISILSIYHFIYNINLDKEYEKQFPYKIINFINKMIGTITVLSFCFDFYDFFELSYMYVVPLLINLIIKIYYLWYHYVQTEQYNNKKIRYKLDSIKLI